MRPLEEPLLVRLGVAHGFGVRGVPAPAGLLRPKQVHGVTVVSAAQCREEPSPEAVLQPITLPPVSV